MRMQKMNLLKTLFIVFVTMGLLTSQSCKNEDVVAEAEGNTSVEVNAEDLRDLTASDLENMKEVLKASGIDVNNLDIYANQTASSGNSQQNNAPSSVADILVKVIKVSTTTKSPDGSGATIPISGVLLVPRFSIFPLRIVVAPVSTYTCNEDAPSNIFKTLSATKATGDMNYLYFLTLQVTQGFAVLFPDYPGFGDSYQKAFPPYFVKQPLVNSTVDLVKASQETLKKNRYSYKKELFLTGYSFGGYVATALAKELDTSKDLPVKLTVAGGIPLNPNELINYAQSAKTLPISYIYPYVLQAYDINESAPFAISDVLKAPYDKAYLTEAFDGTRYSAELKGMFSAKPSELFTDEAVTQFDTGSKFANLRNLLIKNSVEPWKNTNKLVLIHGTSDNVAYYDIAKNFYNKQKNLGGNITFSPIIGTDHFETAIAYYIELTVWLSIYR